MRFYCIRKVTNWTELNEEGTSGRLANKRLACKQGNQALRRLGTKAIGRQGDLGPGGKGEAAGGTTEEQRGKSARKKKFNSKTTEQLKFSPMFNEASHSEGELFLVKQPRNNSV